MATECIIKSSQTIDGKSVDIQKAAFSSSTFLGQLVPLSRSTKANILYRTWHGATKAMPD